MGELQTSNVKPQNNVQSPNGQSTKKRDLGDRLLAFSKSALSLCRMLPRTIECEGIRRQLSKAATSIGANFEEADGTITKKDFINKVCIARKEAKEARYWLKVVHSDYLPHPQVDPQLKECEELIAILSSIIIKCGYRFRS